MTHRPHRPLLSASAAALAALTLGGCLASDLDAPLDDDPVAGASAAIAANPIDPGFGSSTRGRVKLPDANLVARDVAVVGDKIYYVGTKLSVRTMPPPL